MDTIILQKHCPKCNQDFPATTDYFHRNRSARDGLNTYCRACRTGKPFDELTRPEPVPEGYKRCLKCRSVLLATPDNFHSNKSNKDGLQDQCRACRNLNPPLPKVEPVEDGFIRCRQCLNPYPATAEYFHRDRVYKGGLQTTCKQCRKQYYPHETEQFVRRSEYYRAYFVVSKERIYARRHQLYMINAVAVRERARLIYAFRYSAEGQYTDQDVQEQYERQKGKCYWCHKKLIKYHVDHIVPLSRGGTNWPDNIVLACPTCNCSRGNKLPHEWPQGGRLL